MRKRALLLVVILIFVVISTAGCTYQAIHLDKDKKPYSSDTPESEYYVPYDTPIPLTMTQQVR